MERGQAPADGSLSLATRGTTACGGCVGCSATTVPLVLFVSVQLVVRVPNSKMQTESDVLTDGSRGREVVGQLYVRLVTRL
jgi:hypothetical protein